MMAISYICLERLLGAVWPKSFKTCPREIAHPTETSGMMADDIIRPFSREIMNALRPFMPRIQDDYQPLQHIIAFSLNGLGPDPRRLTA